MVRRNAPELASIHEVCEIAESGAQSADLLDRLCGAIKAAQGRIFNRAEIPIDDELERWCVSHGLRPLGRDRGVPFVCLTTTDCVPIRDRLSLSGWRHFAGSNAARFSIHRPGRRDQPAIDCTADLRGAVLKALKR